LDDRDVRIEGRHDVHVVVRVERRGESTDVGVHVRQVALVVRPERHEREVRRAREVPGDHAEVAVLLDLQGRGIRAFDPPADGME
jgi:hypothetical protein